MCKVSFDGDRHSSHSRSLTFVILLHFISYDDEQQVCTRRACNRPIIYATKLVWLQLNTHGHVTRQKTALSIKGLLSELRNVLATVIVIVMLAGRLIGV